MKKIEFITTVFLLFIASAAVYAKNNPDVTECPSVSEIQRVKFDAVATIGPKWAVGIERNYFDTGDRWTFLIEGITAKNAEEATKVGRAAVKSLAYLRGPEQYEDYALDYCEYTTEEGYHGFAYTPSFWGINIGAIQK